MQAIHHQATQALWARRFWCTSLVGNLLTTNLGILSLTLVALQTIGLGKYCGFYVFYDSPSETYARILYIAAVMLQSAYVTTSMWSVVQWLLPAAHRTVISALAQSHAQPLCSRMGLIFLHCASIARVGAALCGAYETIGFCGYQKSHLPSLLVILFHKTRLH